MMPGMQILYGLTDLTDLRITIVKQEGISASPEANQAKPHKGVITAFLGTHRSA